MNKENINIRNDIKQLDMFLDLNYILDYLDIEYSWLYKDIIRINEKEFWITDQYNLITSFGKFLFIIVMSFNSSYYCERGRLCRR